MLPHFATSGQPRSSQPGFGRRPSGVLVSRLPRHQTPLRRPPPALVATPETYGARNTFITSATR